MLANHCAKRPEEEDPQHEVTAQMESSTKASNMEL